MLDFLAKLSGLHFMCLYIVRSEVVFLLRFKFKHISKWIAVLDTSIHRTCKRAYFLLHQAVRLQQVVTGSKLTPWQMAHDKRLFLLSTNWWSFTVLLGLWLSEQQALEITSFFIFWNKWRWNYHKRRLSSSNRDKRNFIYCLIKIIFDELLWKFKFVEYN